MNCIRILIIFLVAFTASCGGGTQGTSAPPARQLADDTGRKVGLPAEVTRAVSLAPNITEIVFEVGAGGKLVGATTFCDYPEAAKKITRVGDTLKPNVETIVALRPQIVFVSTASQLEAFTGLLEARGIKVFVTGPDSLQSVFESIEKIGEVMGEGERAKEAAEILRRRVKAIEEKVKQVPAAGRPKVFVQIDKSLYTVGNGSFITDLVRIAGGVPVTGELETAYPKVSRETAKAYDPDVIILSVSPDNDVPNDVFDGSKAVLDGRIIRIDADVLSRPGPRIVSALEQIFVGLHGQKDR